MQRADKARMMTNCRINSIKASPSLQVCMFDIIKRLSTFTPENWKLKSRRICPYLLTAQGFYFKQGKLTCQGCALQLNFQELPFQFDCEDGEQKIDQFINNSIDSHKELCSFAGIQKALWRQQIEIWSHEHYQEAVLSNQKLRFFPKLKLSARSTQSALRKAFPDDPLDVLKILSVFGWVCRQDQIHCQFCATSVPVTRLTPDSRTIQLKDLYLNQGFDLLQNHRYFCQWGRLQDDEDLLAGWQYCLYLMKIKKTDPQNYTLTLKKMRQLDYHIEVLRDISVRSIDKIKIIERVLDVDESQQLKEQLRVQRDRLTKLQRQLVCPQPRKMQKI